MRHGEVEVSPFRFLSRQGMLYRDGCWATGGYPSLDCLFQTPDKIAGPSDKSKMLDVEYRIFLSSRNGTCGNQVMDSPRETHRLDFESCAIG